MNIALTLALTRWNVKTCVQKLSWIGGGALMNKVILICLTLGASLQVKSAILVTLKLENMNMTKYSRWAGNRDSVATVYLSPMPMATRPSEL